MSADDLFLSIRSCLNEVVEGVAINGAWVLKALTPWSRGDISEIPTLSRFTRFIEELTNDRVGLT